MASGDTLTLIKFSAGELLSLGCRLDQFTEGLCFPELHYNVISEDEAIAVRLAQLASSRPPVRIGMKAKQAEKECS